MGARRGRASEASRAAQPWQRKARPVRAVPSTGHRAARTDPAPRTKTGEELREKTAPKTPCISQSIRCTHTTSCEGFLATFSGKFTPVLLNGRPLDFRPPENRVFSSGGDFVRKYANLRAMRARSGAKPGSAEAAERGGAVGAGRAAVRHTGARRAAVAAQAERRGPGCEFRERAPPRVVPERPGRSGAERAQRAERSGACHQFRPIYLFPLCVRLCGPLPSPKGGGGFIGFWHCQQAVGLRLHVQIGRFIFYYSLTKFRVPLLCSTAFWRCT